LATTSEEIRQSLIHKILIGQYAVGSRLPSCRDLAAELRINRNTASKIYQDLARQGLVKIVRGQGVMVTKQGAPDAVTSPSMRDHILAAAREAKLLGLGRDRFLHLVIEVTDSLYQPQRLKIAFVECNEQDATALAREIESEVSLPVQPVLLSALEQSAQAVAAECSIVCTTLYHLSAVEKALGPAASKMVAVHAPPDPDALLDIARLGLTARVAIICEWPATQQYLTTAVRMVYRGDLQSCLLADARRLTQAEDLPDVVIDVPSCHQQVQRLFPSTRILTVGFRIDSKSLGPLQERIMELRKDEVQNALAGRGGFGTRSYVDTSMEMWYDKASYLS
jgi:DNA-binding transcriptional regulator YhcF (GntR family)